MADGKTIEVVLSEEQLAVVAADVARGGYANPAELVQEALWEWHANHEDWLDSESNGAFGKAVESELVRALGTQDISIDVKILEDELLLEHLRNELQNRDKLGSALPSVRLPRTPFWSKLIFSERSAERVAMRWTTAVNETILSL